MAKQEATPLALFLKESGIVARRREVLSGDS
jgi:hypothetical protein